MKVNISMAKKVPALKGQTVKNATLWDRRQTLKLTLENGQVVVIRPEMFGVELVIEVKGCDKNEHGSGNATP